MFGNLKIEIAYEASKLYTLISFRKQIHEVIIIYLSKWAGSVWGTERRPRDHYMGSKGKEENKLSLRPPSVLEPTCPIWQDSCFKHFFSTTPVLRSSLLTIRQSKLYSPPLPARLSDVSFMLSVAFHINMLEISQSLCAGVERKLTVALSLKFIIWKTERIRNNACK